MKLKVNEHEYEVDTAMQNWNILNPYQPNSIVCTLSQDHTDRINVSQLLEDLKAVSSITIIDDDNNEYNFTLDIDIDPAKGTVLGVTRDFNNLSAAIQIMLPVKED